MTCQPISSDSASSRHRRLAVFAIRPSSRQSGIEGHATDSGTFAMFARN